MIDEVPDPQGLFVAGHLGKVFADVVLHPDLALADEDGQAGGGELLGGRADVEDLPRRHDDIVLDAGHAIAALVDDPPVLDDG